MAGAQGLGEAFGGLAVARGHAERGAVGEDVDVERAERAGADVGELRAGLGELLQAGHRALVVVDDRRLDRDEVRVRGVAAAGRGQLGGVLGELGDLGQVRTSSTASSARVQGLQAHEVRLPGQERELAPVPGSRPAG